MPGLKKTSSYTKQGLRKIAMTSRLQGRAVRKDDAMPSIVKDKERQSTQINGMRGVYLVAAELCRIGFIVSPTSRSARGADILATSRDLKNTLSIEVKTTSTNSFWQIASHARSLISDSHIYVFVKIRRYSDGTELIDYYPVMSKFVSRKSRKPDEAKSDADQYRKGFTIWLEDIEKFKDDWSAFYNKAGRLRKRTGLPGPRLSRG
jgi:hypothetical protein